MVRLERLSKRYGRLTALEALSLDLSRGEILAIVGPNGAGKTTALKLMVGLLAPTSGRVVIGGFDVHRQPDEAKRLLSFIPDQPFLYELLTVEEFLAFLGAVHRLPADATARRVGELSRILSLEAYLSQRIGQLSYGLKSRVVLLASLLASPQVVIMDEPFFGLDPQTLRVMKRLLVELAGQGMTVVLSTHQLSVVEDLATRIAVLSCGRLLDVGTLPELHQRHGGARLEELFFHLTAPSGTSGSLNA